MLFPNGIGLFLASFQLKFTLNVLHVNILTLLTPKWSFWINQTLVYSGHFIYKGKWDASKFRS